MDNERTNGWPDDGRDIPPMGYGLNDTQPPPPTETERERNLRLATEPKITRPKEPCTECGKPTRYGLGHHNAQCSTCQRKIAADEANQLPRVVHPGAFAAPAAAGEMDPIKPSPPPCSPQSSPEPTQAEVNKRARELREQWDSDTLQARIAIDSERQGYKPNPRCPNCNRPMRATETGFRCDPCTDATPEPAECQACEFCTERGVCTQEDDGRCPITMPKNAPHRGPLTTAEETRGRACGELAAHLIASGCPGCGEKMITWNALSGSGARGPFRWRAREAQRRAPIMNLCGHCTACCILPPIPSIGKEAGRPCRKLYDGLAGIGCGAYADRPAACRSFRCGWLAEGWELDLRPDICGVMLTHARSRAGATLTAWELRPGTIRAAWDLWVERAKSAPIAIHFVGLPSVLLCRDGSTVPIPGPSNGKETR